MEPSAVRIRLLGPVGAVTDSGDPIAVGPAKCQALLAALAFHVGTAVPTWRLVELVWGNDPPRTAERTLQSYVTRLRKGLGPDSITRVGAAYCLNLAPDAVDVSRFQRRMDAGEVSAALAEWTGFPLSGLVVPGLAAAADGLVERWLVMVEADLTARVEVDAAATIGQLTELTSNYPFREALWALLMEALYRVGRQGDALAAYRTARRHLVERLGVEPGPRLREVESLVLGHDRRLTVERPSAPPRPGNLPLRLGRLIGRDQELAAIGAALVGSPVVTLVGPGGIGKTRLARAAAQQAALVDEVWLIDLTEVASSSDVPRAVAGPLGVKEHAGRSLLESIVLTLRSRPLLLVLDNCEHVVDGAAALAQAVAEGCPQVRLMATSREGLGLDSGHERLIAVLPLDPTGSGVELFNERAAAVSFTFDPRADRPAVEELCRRVDGVPLAIELAAARTTHLSPADLLSRLDDQLGLLVGGQRTSAARHRTLRATIQWSFDLLGPAEQMLHPRLSIFTGPFDRVAAGTVAGPGPDPAWIDDVLGDLVARSMLVVESGPFGPRYRLLETMRQFAAEHLAATGQTKLIAERHARYCLAQVGEVQRLLAGPDEVEAVARLDELWPNLRAAFDWACAKGDHLFARALIRPLVTEIPLRNRHEIGDWVERILSMTPVDDRESMVFGLTWAAQRYKLSQNPSAYERLAARYGEPEHPLIPYVRAVVHDDYAAVGKTAPTALAELRRRGDDDLAEHVEVDVAAALLFTGQFTEHETLVSALTDRYRRQGPPTLLNWTLMLAGFAASSQGKYAEAERAFNEAVGVTLPERTHSPNKPVEARTHFQRGNRSLAFRLLRSHIDELLDSDNMHGACVVAVEFVGMMAKADQLPASVRILRYAETSGLLHNPVWQAQLAPARRTIADQGQAGAPEGTVREPDLGDRAALEYMRQILLQLA